MLSTSVSLVNNHDNNNNVIHPIEGVEKILRVILVASYRYDREDGVSSVLVKIQIS